MSKVGEEYPVSPVGSTDADRIKYDRAAQYYAAIIESSDDAILSKDTDGVIMSWNRGAQRLFGYSAEEVVGKPVTILMPADRVDEEPLILGRIRRGERVDHYETVRKRKDGSLVDISLTVSPIRDLEGNVVGASKIARDISERKRAQAQQELLLREMNHRIKNLFALAIGVVRLSARAAGGTREVIESACERLSALARAHSLTLPFNAMDAAQGARPTTLHSLIRAIVMPHEVFGDAARFVIIGLDLGISGAAISSLALVLQEFATNSAKYGALSAPKGQVEIVTEVHDQTVVVNWTERCGPTVRPPEHEGFGSILTRAAVTGLGGEISQDWRPEGLKIRVLLPRARLTG
jgi:PAS domain S-box-containing protein